MRDVLSTSLFKCIEIKSSPKQSAELSLQKHHGKWWFDVRDGDDFISLPWWKLCDAIADMKKHAQAMDIEIEAKKAKKLADTTKPPKKSRKGGALL